MIFIIFIIYSAERFELFFLVPRLRRAFACARTTKADSSGKQTIKKLETSASSFASEAKPDFAREKAINQADPPTRNMQMDFFFLDSFGRMAFGSRVNDL